MLSDQEEMKKDGKENDIMDMTMCMCANSMTKSIITIFFKDLAITDTVWNA